MTQKKPDKNKRHNNSNNNNNNNNNINTTKQSTKTEELKCNTKRQLKSEIMKLLIISSFSDF